MGKMKNVSGENRLNKTFSIYVPNKKEAARTF